MQPLHYCVARRAQNRSILAVQLLYEFQNELIFRDMSFDRRATRLYGHIREATVQNLRGGIAKRCAVSEDLDRNAYWGYCAPAGPQYFLERTMIS